MTSVVFTDEELAKIAAALAAKGPKAWEDDDLADLRLRIKKLRLAEQKNQCCYCRQLIPTDHGLAWNLDHVLVRKLYPQFCYEADNLAASCIDCNIAKSIYDALVKSMTRPPKKFPTQSAAYTLCHPRYDTYEDHLMRVADYFYVPLDDKGVETVKACKLHRYAKKRLGVDADPDASLAADLANRLSRAAEPDAPAGSVNQALLEVHFIVEAALKAIYQVK